MSKRIAAFVGSFDPFTIGHAHIVERALQLFDELVIGIGVNPSKESSATPEERMHRIAQLYADNNRVRVECYDDWTADFAHRVGAQCIVKGIRTHKDFIYERRQAEFNRKRNGMETLFLIADKPYRQVSSSLVRKKMAEGKNYNNLIPKE